MTTSKNKNTENLLRRENVVAEIVTIIVCLAALAPLIIIGQYDAGYADDYDYGKLTHQVAAAGGNAFEIIAAAVRTSAEFYNHWQGLYTSAFVQAFQPGIFGECYYVLTPVIVLCLCFVFLFICIHLLNRALLKKTMLFSFAASIFILTIHFALMPSIMEGIFWYNGAMNYTPWAFTTFLNAVLVFKALRSEKLSSLIAYISFATILSFITSGVNHITSFGNILVLLFIALWVIVAKRNTKDALVVIIPLVVAIIGFAIVISSPGTSVRQAETQNASVISTMLHSAYHFIRLLGSWTGAGWLIWLAVITPIACAFAKTLNVKVKLRHALYTTAASVVILIGMICVPYIALGYFGTLRTYNTVWAFYLFLSAASYIVFICWLITNKHLKVQKPNLSLSLNIALGSIAVAAAICLCILIPYNGSETSTLKCARQLTNGTAAAYGAEVAERSALFEDPSTSKVVLEPIKTKNCVLCATDYYREFVEDADEWPNNCVGAYFNKEIYLDTSK